MATRRQAVADILETLSNDEIRQRLILYGYPGISVTDQNRAPLLEMLRQYIDAEQRQHNRNRPEREETESASQSGSNIGGLRSRNPTVAHIPPPAELEPEASPVNAALAGSIVVALLLGLVYFHSLGGK
ncbi:AGAP007422-PA-like protein [Anopheles sinensis]|uniref:AGAP007422-PA-like protein n=1 Tax=Anopheles sinensis TaxID=74873 RepID=A0A084WJD8_ANOSI|nr:AGAP007422-PA-like protein [Anopheles sinensis]